MATARLRGLALLCMATALCAGRLGQQPRPARVSRGQCARVLGLLERIVGDAAIPDSTRSHALFAIFHQRPDAATRTLAQRWAESDEPALKKTAGLILTKLDQRAAAR